MKFLIQNARIVGTATDDYSGPNEWLAAPADFDTAHLSHYSVVDGAVHYNSAGPYDDALTAHLDATAQAKRYDNRITCMVRAGFAGPFQPEGAAFALWADECNAHAYALMGEVMAGAAEMPTVAEFIAGMPEMVWP